MLRLYTLYKNIACVGLCIGVFIVYLGFNMPLAQAATYGYSNSTGGYTATYRSGYTGSYTSSYTSQYTNSYTHSYTNSYTGSYTSNYTGGYTSGYQGNYEEITVSPPVDTGTNYGPLGEGNGHVGNGYSDTIGIADHPGQGGVCASCGNTDSTGNAGATGGYQGGYTPGYQGGYQSSYTGGYRGSYTNSYTNSYTPSYQGSYTNSYTPSYQGSYQSGYVTCSDNQGNSCSSASNYCGQGSSGVIACDGECSASNAPSDTSCVDYPVSITLEPAVVRLGDPVTVTYDIGDNWPPNCQVTGYNIGGTGIHTYTPPTPSNPPQSESITIDAVTGPHVYRVECPNGQVDEAKVNLTTEIFET